METPAASEYMMKVLSRMDAVIGVFEVRSLCAEAPRGAILGKASESGVGSILWYRLGYTAVPMLRSTEGQGTKGRLIYFGPKFALLISVII